MNNNNQEIERKFLVAGDLYRSLAIEKKEIQQGYLCHETNRTVRVRRANAKAFLTIKTAAEKGHLARFEWEKEITLDDFNALFPLCQSGIIEKTRYIVPLIGKNANQEAVDLFVEVDEFHGLNSGLILAEIETPTEDTTYDKPSFLGQEVTGDVRYFNSYLSQRPFITWENNN